MKRFAYAHNNPNTHTDPSGNVVPIVALLFYGAAAIAGTFVATKTYEAHERHNLEGEEKGWAKNDPRRSWGAALGDGSGMRKAIKGFMVIGPFKGRINIYEITLYHR